MGHAILFKKPLSRNYNVIQLVIFRAIPKSNHAARFLTTESRMTYHTKDGREFVGLRERRGLHQIVYDNLNGRRVILDLEDAAPEIATINGLLSRAVTTRNVLGAVLADLTTNQVRFDVAQ